MPLTDLEIRKQTISWLSDGNSLYSRLSKSGTKSFVHRLKSGSLHLGNYSYELSLSKARDLNMQVKLAVKSGVNIATIKRALRQTKDANEFTQIINGVKSLENFSAAITFREAHELWHKWMVDNHQWSHGKHIKQNWETVARVFYPFIGDMPVNKISTNDIVEALSVPVKFDFNNRSESSQVYKPFWLARHETAYRCLGRCKSILSYCINVLEIDMKNPADIDHRYKLLKPKRRKINHHPRLSYDRASDFWEEFNKSRVLDAPANVAAIFVMLTAVRVGDVVSMRWEDLDIENLIWSFTVGKTGRLFRTPIPEKAMNALQFLNKSYEGFEGYVFSKPKNISGHLTENVVTKNIQKVQGFNGLVSSHGWRATLKTWATSVGYRHEITEMQLSHERDELEAAYNDADYFDDRRVMLQHWQDVLTGKTCCKERARI